MYRSIKPVMSVDSARESVPLLPEAAELRRSACESIREILGGRDRRKLIIVGPCSADDPEAVCDYARRIAKTARRISDVAFVVLRVYTVKPRTRDDEYNGMFFNPDRFSNKHDIESGIVAARSLHIRVMQESGLSTADEMLYPDCFRYLDDVVSYVAVGARSAENRMHRLVASGLDLPVGIKNPTSGYIPAWAECVRSAQTPQEFLWRDSIVSSSGNPYAHGVLRGAVGTDGATIPNYDSASVQNALDAFTERGVLNPSVIIDCNHSNSGKDPFKQADIAMSVLTDMRRERKLEGFVKGFMIESYIEDGKQERNGTVYGKSVTDACLGIDKTEDLLMTVSEQLRAF